MKKYLLIILLISLILTINLLAQVELTIVGGVNLASVKYNDNTIDNYYDILLKPGLIAGVEAIGGPFIIGGSFIQRGAETKSMNDEDDFEGSDTYNYVSGYLLYPVKVQKVLSIFGGCQIGKLISGSATIKEGGSTQTFNLEAEDYALNFGLLFGADFMLNSNIGARASYFIGLSNVVGVAGYPSEYNYKNRGIGLCLLYKM